MHEQVSSRASQQTRITGTTDYWDALAPYHYSIENNYFDLGSLHRIVQEIRPPVLVVGAGQGLIVGELRKNGIQSDGVDLSSKMVRYAKARRGLEFVQADARELPFEEGAYKTIICASGVVDFTADEEQVRLIIDETRRIVNRPGYLFVAFYRFSSASEDFLARLGLLRNNVLSFRETLELQRLNPVQAIAWVAKKIETGFFHAGISSIRAWLRSTLKEKALALNMQRILRKKDHANSLITSAPKSQPYRNELEIRSLFKRLAIPINKFEASASCYIVQI